MKRLAVFLAAAVTIGSIAPAATVAATTTPGRVASSAAAALPADAPSNLPSAFLDATPGAPGASVASIGWWQLVRDEQLKALIREALANNFDLRVAVQHVLEAQAQLGVVNAALTPQLGAGTNLPWNEISGRYPSSIAHSTFTPTVGLNASYQLDLFGRLRYASAAAAAQLLATEDARETVVASVVAGVVTTYDQLLELDTERDIAQRTLDARTQSLRLVQLRLDGGVGTLQDVRQAQQLQQTAAATLATANRGSNDAQVALTTLLGRYPGPIARGADFRTEVAEQVGAMAVPPTGVPAELLTMRPDIRAVEQQLVAAKAQVGVARALLYPQISLGGSAAIGAHVITGVASGPAYLFSLIAQIAQTIFDGGGVRANIRLSEAQREEAALRYVQAVVGGVADVDGSLDDLRQFGTQVEAQTALATAATDSARLADVRFRGGVTTYLEVLDSDTRAFDAQLQLARTQLAQVNAAISLYVALGGGWQPEPR